MIVILVILTLCLLTFQTSAQTIEISKSIDEYMSIRTENGDFNGAILVAKDGRILFRKGYGFADIKKRTPYAIKTKHKVASVSKMFTAFAILNLQDKKKLKTTDLICEHLNDCPELWKKIRIEDLIHHTSGIPDYEEELGLRSKKYLDFMLQPQSSARILQNAKTKKLDFTPSEKFKYSNTGYIVLSHIVEKVSGQNFEEYIVKNIFEPARMKNSGVIGSDKSPENLAPGYTHDFLGWEKVIEGIPITKRSLKKIPQLKTSPAAGDAFMYSTIDDLYRWSQIMEGRTKLADSAFISEIFKSTKFRYGYGWFTGNSFNRKRHRHTGQLPEYVIDFVRFPEEKITIIVTSNLDRSPLGRIMRDVSAMVLETPFDMPVYGKIIELTKKQNVKLTGQYKMDDGKYPDTIKLDYG